MFSGWESSFLLRLLRPCLTSLVRVYRELKSSSFHLNEHKTSNIWPKPHSKFSWNDDNWSNKSRHFEKNDGFNLGNVNLINENLICMSRNFSNVIIHNKLDLFASPSVEISRQFIYLFSIRKKKDFYRWCWSKMDFKVCTDEGYRLSRISNHLQHWKVNNPLNFSSLMKISVLKRDCVSFDSLKKFRWVSEVNWMIFWTFQIHIFRCKKSKGNWKSLKFSQAWKSWMLNWIYRNKSQISEISRSFSFHPWLHDSKKYDEWVYVTFSNSLLCMSHRRKLICRTCGLFFIFIINFLLWQFRIIL